MADPHRLFLANLAWDVTQAEIQAACDDFGVGDKIQHIHIPRRGSVAKGDNKGSTVAFITVAKQEDIQAMIVALHDQRDERICFSWKNLVAQVAKSREKGKTYPSQHREPVPETHEAGSTSKGYKQFLQEQVPKVDGAKMEEPGPPLPSQHVHLHHCGPLLPSQHVHPHHYGPPPHHTQHMQHFGPPAQQEVRPMASQQPRMTMPLAWQLRAPLMERKSKMLPAPPWQQGGPLPPPPRPRPKPSCLPKVQAAPHVDDPELDEKMEKAWYECENLKRAHQEETWREKVKKEEDERPPGPQEGPTTSPSSCFSVPATSAKAEHIEPDADSQGSGGFGLVAVGEGAKKRKKDKSKKEKAGKCQEKQDNEKKDETGGSDVKPKKEKKSKAPKEKKIRGPEPEEDQPGETAPEKVGPEDRENDEEKEDERSPPRSRRRSRSRARSSRRRRRRSSRKRSRYVRLRRRSISTYSRTSSSRRRRRRRR